MTAITMPHAAITPRDPRSIVIVMQTIEVGGMEAYCIDLACEYARRGIRVTAVIPGTTSAAHMRDNVGAMRGPFPDSEQRKKMVAFIANL